MGVNSLPKTVTRQRRGCDMNPGPSAPESSTLTTRLYRATPIVLWVETLFVHLLRSGAGGRTTVTSIIATNLENGQQAVQASCYSRREHLAVLKV